MQFRKILRTRPRHRTLEYRAEYSGFVKKPTKNRLTKYYEKNAAFELKNKIVIRYVGTSYNDITSIIHAARACFVNGDFKTLQ